MAYRAFKRPSIELSSLPKSSGKDGIRSLPDLIDFNARSNPDHLFALQEEREGGAHTGFAEISFAKLQQLVRQATIWLENTALGAGQDTRSRPDSKNKAVALFLESDLTLFIYLCALLSTEIPVVLLSARLSTPAVTHLLLETQAQAIICSKRMERGAKEAIQCFSPGQALPTIVSAITYGQLIRLLSTNNSGLGTLSSSSSLLEDLPGSIILHSSGTTGLPKPIPLTHRYLLGYATCHRLKPEEAEGRLNVSTLPFYHGFGLLAPCLSLSVGKTCCIPSSSIIPAAESTIDLLKAARARSLMTVPTILEELVQSKSGSYEVMAELDFVAIGGGALKSQVGKILAAKGVRLLNHYGATEIGAIAYICVPDNNYDWHYLRLRTDLGLELVDINRNGEMAGFCRLIGHPFGWQSPFELQDMLERNTSSDSIEVRVLGRTDDLIVLATGEKVMPQALESSLNKLDVVQTSVVFGEQRNEIGVLVEPVSLFASQDHEWLKDVIWSTLQNVNPTLDGHARVASRNSILVKPTRKAIPRSDKGSVMRKETYQLFFQEIDAIYENLEKSVTKEGNNTLDKQDLKTSLKELVQLCFQRCLPSDSWDFMDDFFELGMDSLEAARLCRLLANLANIDEFPGLRSVTLRPAFIYRHPTISRLAAAIEGGTVPIQPVDDVLRARSLKAVRDKYISHSRDYHNQTRPLVVLLTGSTGNLGTNLLNCLTHHDRIMRVICLNRHRHQPGTIPSSDVDSRRRQIDANARHGIRFSETHWSKIKFMQTDTREPNLGLCLDDYRQLASEVTHIIHSAWPMDFQRTLDSYESQVQIVRHLLDFAKKAHGLQQQRRPRLLFLSSIAVAGRFQNIFLPEEHIEDPCLTVPMGYAEAKWACEQVLGDATEFEGDLVEPIIVRIGQITGSSITGYWNPSEHIPELIKASQEIGVLPDLHGTLSWLPVDVASRCILEILLAESSMSSVFHIENPIRQPWPEIIQYLSYRLQIPSQKPEPFDNWIRRSVTSSKSSFITPLEEFFKNDFLNLSTGRVVLDTKQARNVSPTLRSCGGVSLELLDKYITSWKQYKVLQKPGQTPLSISSRSR